MTPPHAPARAAGPCRRTLVVEDDRVSRLALELLLRGLGQETRAAATLAEGLEQLAAWRPDCVVLDLMLPDGSGTELLARVRGMGLPVRVAVASGADDLHLAEARALRPDALFRKPIDVDRLAAWLDAAGG